jgi:hypothetical protein
LFAAGIIFLEIIALQEVNGLYDNLYPKILSKDLPKSLLLAMRSSLDWDPSHRTSFQAIFDALSNDDSSFDKVDENSGALEVIDAEMEEMEDIAMEDIDDGMSGFSEPMSGSPWASEPRSGSRGYSESRSSPRA